MAEIILKDVIADFPIYGSQLSFRHALFGRVVGGVLRRQTDTGKRVVVRALDNVSLTIMHGDQVGIIGHNGAGKSTLLRVLAGIYEPSQGTVNVKGNVSPLFNVSPGLDLDDTGYDNIVTCGLLLGMTRDEIENKLPEIEEFCELSGYLALPARTYSTGMLVRLGFAIATSIDPEILLLDEWLGAGDARFAERATQRIQSMIERSSIVVLASHSDELILKMCNRVILLNHGRVIANGPTADVIDIYMRKTQEEQAAMLRDGRGPPEDRREGEPNRHRLIHREETMEPVKNVKIFADGADFDGIMALYKNPLIKGFTTNPTLMRKAGIERYEDFARRLVAAIPDRPISFEVFADDFDEMIAQGRVIASWAANVNVKIPVTTTKGAFSGPVIRALADAGVIVNVTAIMTEQQVERVAECLAPSVPAIVSVFAGRVADTGRDPVPVMRNCLRALADRPKAELLWASPRELLNIFQADEIGCHIITVSHDVLAKLSLIGKDLDEYSLETVKMFHRDATAAGFAIATTPRRAAS